MRLMLSFILALALPGAGLAQDCAGQRLEGADYLGAPLCIPADPQRILVLDPAFSLGMALELGLPVVAAPLTGMSDTVLKARAEAAGVADIGFMLDPSVEAIVGAGPDLIIGSVLAESYLPLLSQIAPVVLLAPEDWRSYFAALARIGGNEARLAALMAPLDERITDLRGKVPGTVVSSLRITPWDFQVYPGGPGAWAPYALMSELGIRRSAYEQSAAPPEVLRPDWEEIGGLDGEILLYIIGGSNASGSNGRWEEVSANPLWQLLPAVAAGRVYPLDPGIWMEFSGTQAAHRVLDDLERLVIAPQ